LLTTTLDAGPEREAMTNDRTHVVVIEDAAATRELVQVVVEDASSTETLARDGAAALDVLWAPGCVPDVMVVDVRMPLVDGRTCRRMQQGYPQWRTIPVIAVSAEREVHAIAAVLGMAAVLLKAFTVPELLRTVQRDAH
jgi:CheY-like chemotaxis protein